jgi:hypothetical protein
MSAQKTLEPTRAFSLLIVGLMALESLWCLAVLLLYPRWLHWSDALFWSGLILLVAGLYLSPRLFRMAFKPSPLYRRKSFAGIALGLSVITAAIYGVALDRVFSQPSANQLAASCQANMQKLENALLRYAQDHNGAFPDAHKWCDQILPYVDHRQYFICSTHPKKPAVMLSMPR